MSNVVPSAESGSFLHNLPLMGSAVALRSDPLGYLLRLATRGEPVVPLSIGLSPSFFLPFPDEIRHVLVEKAFRYKKPDSVRQATRRILGNGLVTSEGDYWKRQRRLIQPLFHKQRIEGFATIMSQCGREMLEGWKANPTGAAIDVAHEANRVTMRIAGLTLLSQELGAEGDVVGPAVSTAAAYAYDQMISAMPTPDFWPSPSMLRYKAVSRKLNTVIFDIIERRMRDGAKHHDLLSMLLEVQDEDTGEKMTPQQIRDEVMTLYLAGHETTANALSFTLYLLAKHPAIQRQVQAEVRAALGDRDPTAQDLPKLSFTERVVHESMRLYPSVWIMLRESLEADEIAGRPIPKGSRIYISPYVVHRDGRFWDNPEGFDPDHFLPEAVKARPRYAHVPFGAGQRMCIGASFATLELVILVAQITRAFQLRAIPGVKVEPEPVFTLRPRHGLPLAILPAP